MGEEPIADYIPFGYRPGDLGEPGDAPHESRPGSRRTPEETFGFALKDWKSLAESMSDHVYESADVCKSLAVRLAGLKLSETVRVYFIGCERLGLVKIGRSRDPRVRLQGLLDNAPYKLRLLKTLPGDYTLERFFHRLFARDRERGEWFRFGSTIRAFVDALPELKKGRS